MPINYYFHAGRAPTNMLKVSGIYMDGYKVTGELLIGGLEAREKVDFLQRILNSVRRWPSVMQLLHGCAECSKSGKWTIFVQSMSKLLEPNTRTVQTPAMQRIRAKLFCGSLRTTTMPERCKFSSWRLRRYSDAVSFDIVTVHV